MSTPHSSKPRAPTAKPASGISGSPIANEISVVIPTLGRPIIERCLESIGAGSALPSELIVVDQGGSNAIDNWLEPLARQGIVTRHLHMQGTGRAAAVNRGLEAVRTPFALITDDDCEVDKDWLSIMVDRLRKRSDMAITGAVLSGGSEPVLNVVRDRRSSIATRPRLTFDRLSGGNCGLPVAVLQKVGLFDEDPCTRFAEDGEWAYRALRQGVEIAYEPGARVVHLGWRETPERLHQYRGYARSHAAFFGKYLRQGDLFIAGRAIVHVMRALLRWLRGTLRGDRELAANGRAYVTQFIPGIIDGMRSDVRPPTLP